MIFDAFKGWSKELCPFCFEYFNLSETPFRCTSPMAVCAPKLDKVFAKHWDDHRPMGKVLPSEGSFLRKIRCVDCNQESTKRLCPNCHSQLPHTTGDFKNYIFAVIGAKEAGKSHYLAVLIEQIKRRVGPSLNILLEAMSDNTIDRYRNDFYDPVFKRGRIIQATSSGVSNKATVRQPLVYSLTIEKKRLIGVSRSAVVLVFFDTAGEDLNDEDVMSSVNKYIYRSNGIILLIDPLQIGEVRARLSKAALPGVNTETADIMNRTTLLIQKGRALKATDKIPIPLAVSFSKFDAVKPLIDEQFQLNSVARHEGGFDRVDFEAINSEMMALLDDWGNEELVHQVQMRYRKFGFFGLSALGCNPHGTGGDIPRVQPFRVEDPFLWLLAQNKLIKSVKR